MRVSAFFFGVSIGINNGNVRVESSDSLRCALSTRTSANPISLKNWNILRRQVAFTACMMEAYPVCEWESLEA